MESVRTAPWWCDRALTVDKCRCRGAQNIFHGEVIFFVQVKDLSMFFAER